MRRNSSGAPRRWQARRGLPGGASQRRDAMTGDARYDGVRAMQMRGGTSKGPYFLADDPPAAAADRDALLLRIMGSPDPTQIDGVGGAHPLRSKVALVSPSAVDGIEIFSLFLQVTRDQPVSV